MKRDALITLAIMPVFTLAVFWAYFDLRKDISRVAVQPGELHTDLTPQFGTSAILWGQALARGQAAHWNPYILSGTPNLGNPQSRLVSIENVLNLFTRGQVAARLSIPIQIGIGWLGIYLLVGALGLGAPYALILGSIYLFNPSFMGYHVGTGHVNIVNGVTLAPWLAYLTLRPFRRQHVRPLLAGIVIALMLHSGAATVAVYSCAVFYPAYLLFWGPRRGWRRALLDLAIASLAAMGLSWIKLVPAIDFLRISDRRHGMSTAMAFMNELHFPLREAPLLLAALSILAVVGALELYRRSRLGFGAALALGLLLSGYVFVEPVFDLARRSVPLLASMRIPSRVLFVLYFEFGLLVCLGVQRIASLFKRPIVAGAVVWVVAGALLIAAPRLSPPGPTMVDGEARREANPVLRHVRSDPAFFRLTSFQDRDRHWGYQHQTIPYGIRTFLGYTAIYAGDFMYSHYSASLRQPQHAFVPRVFDNFAGMTGLLSVKYVSSMEALGEADLRLIEEFPISDLPQPPKSRGPYLYENQRAMPRAYQGTATVAVTGTESEVRQTILDLIADPRFRPDRFTLIAAPEGIGARADFAVERADLVLDASGAEPRTSTRRVARDQLLQGSASVALRSVPVDEPFPELLRIDSFESAGGRWLILSEKLALVRGWTASVREPAGQLDRPLDLPLLRANHVNTAVWLPDTSAGPLQLSYRSPGFRGGLLLMLITSIALAIAFSVRIDDSPTDPS